MEQDLNQLTQENAALTAMHEDAMSQINALTMDAELARLEFEQVFDAMGDPTWVLNNECEILRINKAFLDLLGLESRDQAISKKCHDILPFAHCASEQCPMRQMKKKRQRMETELELKLTKKGSIPFLVTTMPFLGLTGEMIGIVEQFKNVDERKRYEEALRSANEKLERLATLDGLTQLPNRRVFDEQFEVEWKRMRREKLPLSLVMCDVDFFKRYNDHYGHQEGDECLKDVAICVCECVRRPADLPARYGGEEFVILLPNTEAEGAAEIAEKIRCRIEAMGREHAWSDVSDSITLSLGVAAIVPPINDSRPEDLLKWADDALYAAKQSGRNCVITAKPR
jgi:diguanylate cyclase (GGDEF)-like protein/PAS domain S-box-containing protein